MNTGFAPMVGLWLVVSIAQAVALQAHDANAELQQRLDEAAELNFARHWEHARQVLDELEPDLAGAHFRLRASHTLEMAMNHALAGELSAGLKLLNRLLDQELDPDQRLHALSQAATLASMAREHEQAFGYLRAGLELKPQVDDPVQLASLLGIASQMHARVGEYEQAIALGHRAVEHAEASEHPGHLCIARQRLASSYSAGPDQAVTETYYLLALAACEEVGNPYYIGAIEYGLANLMIEQGRLDSAGELITRAIDRLEQVGYEAGLSDTRLVWARYLLERGREDEAEAMLLDLSDRFRSAEAWDHLATVHELLAGIHVGRADHSSAAVHLAEQLQAREKFLDRDRSRRLAYLQVAFDMSAKEQELALLREQARVSELQEQTRQQQRRVQRMGIAGGAVLMLALTAMLAHASYERRHFRKLSRRDSLTGLYNHTRFFERAGEVLAQAKREASPVTLVLADVDHFKRVNDRHGHHAGDQVLRRVAGRMREEFGENGLIGRIGGEEFGFMLPAHDLEQAGAAIERLRQNLNRSRLDDDPIGITMSFGAARAQPGESLVQLRQRADRALYEAKAAGRDGVRLAVDG